MRRLVGWVTTAVVLGAAGVAMSEAPVTLAFAMLSQRTGWYVYGTTMAELLRKALPPGAPP